MTIPVELCPVCGGNERSMLFVGCDRLHTLPGRFPLARCITCGSAYLTEFPADISAYYPPKSYAAYDGEDRHYSRAPGRVFGLARRRHLLATLRPEGGRLLDIGCGSGDFLAAMQSVPGWQVKGLEPSADAARYAREVRTLDVQQGVLPQSDWPSAVYDVITLWHVFEHVAMPSMILSEVHRLLTASGILVVAVPVADSVEASLFGEAWAGYDVPRHLTTFTRAGLTQLLMRAGFEISECPGVILGVASLRLSLKWWLTERHIEPHLQQLLILCGLPWLYLYLCLHGRRGMGVGVFVARKSSGA